MILGRPGHQKSGFALWWTAMMNLRTLYFSADMTAFQASVRLACMHTGRTTEEVEREMQGEGREAVEASLAHLNLQFAFGSPITQYDIEAEIEAYVDLWNDYPEVMVFDNLMDFEAGESDYAAQMAILQYLDSLKKQMGTTFIVLHHATDKGARAMQDPYLPPARSEAKGGLAEKPELSLGAALNSLDLTFRIAPLKQRMGPSDQSGNTFARLQAEPSTTRFYKN